jgi:hypothetical protein
MKYPKVFFLSAIFLLSAPTLAAKPGLCDLASVSYNLPVKTEMSSKLKDTPTQALVTFSLCKMDNYVSEYEKNKYGTFRKGLYDFFFLLANADKKKFKAFFENDKADMEQYEAFLKQFPALLKKGNLKFENFLITEAIEDDHWALYGLNLKGKSGYYPYKIIFRKNAKREVKVALSDKTPEPLVNEIYSAFFTEPVLGGRPAEVPTHMVTIGSYNNKTPMVQLEFNVLSPASSAFLNIQKIFSQLTAFAQKNDKKNFLKSVKNPESYQKNWGFGDDNTDLLQIGEYWKTLTPVAALDLDPVYIVYFADQNKTNILHIYRFMKVDDQILLLSESLDLNQELYRLPLMKAGALEALPFSSLKKATAN